MPFSSVRCYLSRAFAVMLLGVLASSMVRAYDDVEFWREPTNLPFDVTVLEQKTEDGIVWQSMVYTSEIRHDEPMRIFAFYAHPTAPGKYPGVLDIHGGGGSATLSAAKNYARAGYACLSYDWNTFQDPKANWKAGDPLPAKPYTVFGNIRYDDWGGQFVQLGNDYKDSVLYRSVMAARRGLTWMSQQPEVDATKLAVEGHSWGGFTTQLVAGIDPRVKAAVSSAAAGAWISRYKIGLEGHTNALSGWDYFQWARRYDPASRADRITAPILIRLGVSDFFGSVDTLADYWPTITAQKNLELLPCSNHTFGDEETRIAWFNHWLKNGPAFPAVTESTLTPGANGSWTLTVKASGPAPIVKAGVCWTTAPGAWNARTWAERPMTQDGDAWTTTFTPVNAGGPLRVYGTVHDANGRVVSCMPIIRTLPKPATVPTVITKADVGIARTTTPGDWQRAKAIGPLANGPEVLGEQSANLDTQWDADALYLRIRVDDPSPWIAPAPGTPWWSADSVQVRLRTDANALDNKVKDQQVLHLGWYPDPKTGALVTDAVRGADFKGVVKDTTPVQATVAQQAGKGYTLTVRLPWSFIDATLQPAAGRPLRFALMVNYGDFLTTERIGAIDFNGAGSFNNPNDWGTATLLGE